MKTLDTLVDDIYTSLKPLTKGQAIEVSDEAINKATEDFRQALIHWARPSDRNSGFNIRMSNVGKPSRQLWYSKRIQKEVDMHPSVQIKFLYGHILEVVAIFLSRLAGHEVTDEQKEVSLKGVKGHIDCKINGEVVDIKTASRMSFRKFQTGEVAQDDPFGYLAQLSSYEEAEGTSNGGFLVISKETGELCFYKPEELDKPNVVAKIGLLQKILDFLTPPERCYHPIPEGTKGNMKLPRPCTFCEFKFECYKDANNGKGLRVFKYAKGPVYLTKVEALPKVEEI